MAGGIRFQEQLRDFTDQNDSENEMIALIELVNAN
jgi:hypothetical protein